jgi:hypothetical protein
MSWQHEWKEGNCETISVRELWEVLINRDGLGRKVAMRILKF